MVMNLILNSSVTPATDSPAISSSTSNYSIVAKVELFDISEPVKEATLGFVP
jgi:hypothetical protein